MSTTTTPYMGLVLPVPSSEIGPDWASELITAINSIDSHNHSSGQGVAVPTAGLNINADLSLNSFNLITMRSVRLKDNITAITGASDLNVLHCAGGNLYYRDGSGNQIQLTIAGALNASSVGGIGGDYATSTASVAYNNTTKVFTFTQAASTSAKVDFGDILLRKTSASSNAITLKAAAGLSADYTLTLPAAAPGATSYVQVDSSGNLAFSTPVIPAGTKMVFYQAAAPTGWTRDTTSADNRFLRVVTAGSPGTNGGAFSLGLESSHTHSMQSHTHQSTTPSTGWNLSVGGVTGALWSNTTGNGSGWFSTSGNTMTSTGPSTVNTGSGAAHTHTHTSAEHLYSDMLLASKDAY